MTVTDGVAPYAPTTTWPAPGVGATATDGLSATTVAAAKPADAVVPPEVVTVALYAPTTTCAPVWSKATTAGDGPSALAVTLAALAVTVTD